MEASKAKPASRCARARARLSDLDKPPRRWWYPPSSRRDDALRISGPARQAYQKVVQQARERFSETIRLAMLSLLGFALFCLLITLSTPDSSLLVADPTIKMPLADVQVSFQSFLILAPFLLIIITLYLHIFYGYWLDFDTDYRHLLASESGELAIERSPTLFSLDHRVPRLLTAFIFYWLVPLVLIVITRKAAARVEWGVPLVLFTGLVTATLVFLRIRRCPTSQRQWNWPLWGVMASIVGGMAFITLQLVAPPGRPGVFSAERTELVVVPQWLPRPLNIVRADLQGKWLTAVNLRDACARLAKLQGADLQGADLQGADLQGADFQGADFQGTGLRRADLQGTSLRRADLQGAKLQGVNLLHANLERANLQGADLRSATLERANLQGANLQGADLRRANLRDANFYGAELRRARLSEAKLEGVDFRRADLTGVNFSGAKLEGADVREARLEGAKHLTDDQLATLKNLDPAQIDDELRERFQKKYPQRIPAVPANAQTLTTDSAKGRITSPVGGEKVGKKIPVHGSIHDLPRDGRLWLAVQKGNLIWPKEPEVPVTDSSWAVTVYEEGTRSGGRFDLVLYLVDHKGHQQILEWLRDGNATDAFPGLELETIPGSRLDTIQLHMHMPFRLPGC